jgi:hypothetical protein
MLAGILCALVLLGTLFVVRVGCPRGGEPGTIRKPRRLEVVLGAIAVLLPAFPLLRLAPWVNGPPVGFWADTSSHARVAAEIARTLLPHGWIDSYAGGFPFGHHYPQLGWLFLAAEIRAGLSPAAAVHLLGFCATLAVPFSLYFALVRCAVRPLFAWMGAAFWCMVSPYNPFFGGYEAFFATGLVSQTLALPLCIWLVVATIQRRDRWEAPLAVWLSMASHPQITVAVIVVLGLALLASMQRDAMASGVRTAAVSLLAGAALYGQGLTTLDVPFGWPPLGWLQLGFVPARLRWWLLDGDLLDRDRASVLTAMVAAALLSLLLGARRPANRALVVALSSSVLLGVSGHSLLDMGRVGSLLLSFLQPLRVVSLIPPLAAATVAVALERAALLLALALARARRRNLARQISVVLAALAATIVTFAVPSRMGYSSKRALLLRQGSISCSGDPLAPPGYDRDVVRGWLASLTLGRLWYEVNQETALGRCLISDGVDLASAVPIASVSAVGAHVGVLANAAQHLDADRAGSALRAEALGIGYLLRESTGDAPLRGWSVREQRGGVQLLSQSAQTVGVGCIRHLWSGSPAQIRSRLFHDVATPDGSDLVLDPHRFTAIEYAPGAIVESEWPDSGCRADEASVSVLSPEPGAVEATVQSPAPVDVVFRVTAFPTWRVLVDGAPAGKPTLVAPGFFSVRVPPGRHVLSAEVSLLSGYAWIVMLAAMATALLAWAEGHRPSAPFRWLWVLKLRPR